MLCYWTKWCMWCSFLFSRLLLSTKQYLRPQQETVQPFMSLRTASIYQASAGSIDLWQDAIWSYLSEVDFGFIVANIAYTNLGVWRGVLCLSFSFGLSSLQFIVLGVLSLDQNLIYSASSSFIFKTNGLFNIVRQSLSSKIWPMRKVLLKADI